MRLDKYLKVSRIIKRRTVANEACDSGRVMLNDKVARASAEVKVGDRNCLWYQGCESEGYKRTGCHPQGRCQRDV